MAIKHCVVCGKEFVDYGRGKYCQGPHYKKCIICGKDFEYDVRAQHQPKTCSHKCAGLLATQSPIFKLKICQKCGKQFVPNSGVQKICNDCKNLIDN